MLKWLTSSLDRPSKGCLWAKARFTCEEKYLILCTLWTCHAERSEASASAQEHRFRHMRMLRCAQHDRSLPILMRNIHQGGCDYFLRLCMTYWRMPASRSCFSAFCAATAVPMRNPDSRIRCIKGSSISFTSLLR